MDLLGDTSPYPEKHVTEFWCHEWKTRQPTMALPFLFFGLLSPPCMMDNLGSQGLSRYQHLTSTLDATQVALCSGFLSVLFFIALNVGQNSASHLIALQKHLPGFPWLLCCPRHIHYFEGKTSILKGFIFILGFIRNEKLINYIPIILSWYTKSLSRCVGFWSSWWATWKSLTFICIYSLSCELCII